MLQANFGFWQVIIAVLLYFGLFIYLERQKKQRKNVSIHLSPHKFEPILKTDYGKSILVPWIINSYYKDKPSPNESDIAKFLNNNLEKCLTRNLSFWIFNTGDPTSEYVWSDWSKDFFREWEELFSINVLENNSDEPFSEVGLFLKARRVGASKLRIYLYIKNKGHEYRKLGNSEPDKEVFVLADVPLELLSANRYSIFKNRNKLFKLLESNNLRLPSYVNFDSKNSVDYFEDELGETRMINHSGSTIEIESDFISIWIE